MNNPNYPPPTRALLGMAAAGYDDSRGEQSRVTDGYGENLNSLQSSPLTRPNQPYLQQTNITPPVPVRVQQSRQGQEESRMVANSTPMAYLNQLCAQKKIMITSHLTTQGPANNLTFECILQVVNGETATFGGSTSSSGTGKSKKEARHEAAKALLLKHDLRVEELISYTLPLRTPASTAASASSDATSDVGCTDNPVGDLNDLCMKARFPPPIYEDLVDASPGILTATSMFRISCRLHQKISDIGQGTSKKEAKKESAAKVLAKVRQVMEDPQTAKSLFPDGDQDELCLRMAAFTLSKEKVAKSGPLQSHASSPKSLVETVLSLKARRGEKLAKLMTMQLVDFKRSEHILILEEVATEQHIKLEFLDFSPHLDEAKYKSMLSLGMGDASLVFVGNGNNTVAARKDASYNGLEYLRLTYRYGN